MEHSVAVAKLDSGPPAAPRKPEKPSVSISSYSNHHHKLRGPERRPQAEPTDRSELSTDLFSASKVRAIRWTARASHMRALELPQIRGPSGSVRGHRHVVRKSIENITAIWRLLGTPLRSESPPSSLAAAAALDSLSLKGSQPPTGPLDELELANRLAHEDQERCVLYTTTLGIVRRTFEDSKRMRSILGLNLIRFEERDIYLNREFKRELRARRLAAAVPALFVDGVYLGGIKELELLNESDALAHKLAKFKMSQPDVDTCSCCGNARFIACQSCNGSRKSRIHHFKFNSVALRCIKCDSNDGLVQCPVCTAVDQNNNNNINNTSEAAKLE